MIAEVERSCVDRKVDNIFHSLQCEILLAQQVECLIVLTFRNRYLAIIIRIWLLPMGPSKGLNHE